MSLLELSIKWRIPVSHMTFMMKELNMDDCKVFEEKGTLRKAIKDVIVENIQVAAEEKTLFWKDYRKFITQMEESSDHKIGRRVTLQFFRSLIAKGSPRVMELSKTERWIEKECGYRLASVLAELDALMCTLLQQSTLPNHSCCSRFQR
ncbi:hypothetical protein Bca4012_090200 [Brassica carinata]